MPGPIYAIGDIHGQLGMLETALARIDADGGADARIVFVGDYVDRGPDCRGVISLLSDAQAAGRNWVFLKGNHDRFFEWYLQEPEPRQDPHLLVGYHWFHEALGGVETVGSYGVDATGRIRQTELAAQLRDAVPAAHQAFLRGLKLCHREGDLFFAHAGIRPGVPLDAQSETDLLWIRQEFLTDPRRHEAFIVHGHTPVRALERKPNRLNIDTGAGYDRPLSAVVLEDGQVWELTQAGRVAVPVQA